MPFFDRDAPLVSVATPGRAELVSDISCAGNRNQGAWNDSYVGTYFCRCRGGSCPGFRCGEREPGNQHHARQPEVGGHLSEHDWGRTLASLPSPLLAPPWSLALPAPLPSLVVVMP